MATKKAGFWCLCPVIGTGTTIQDAFRPAVAGIVDDKGRGVAFVAVNRTTNPALAVVKVITETPAGRDPVAYAELVAKVRATADVIVLGDDTDAALSLTLSALKNTEQTVLNTFLTSRAFPTATVATKLDDLLHQVAKDIEPAFDRRNVS